MQPTYLQAPQVSLGMRKSQSLESRAEKDSLADLARSILASRRRRAQFFGNGIFSDPSWDILLDLRAHHGSERRISSLFVADCAPVSTGLTHLRRLHERGLVDRWVDPKDGRRRLARLSDHGLALMDQFLLALRTTSAMRN